MGKKRRLNSAKAKFSAKHKNHPRARFLAKKAQEAPKTEIVEEIKMADLLVEAEKLTIEVTLKQEKPEPVMESLSSPPKVKKTSPIKKKKTTTSKKRATKKKTTSAVA